MFENEITTRGQGTKNLRLNPQVQFLFVCLFCLNKVSDILLSELIHVAYIMNRDMVVITHAQGPKFTFIG